MCDKLRYSGCEQRGASAAAPRPGGQLPGLLGPLPPGEEGQRHGGPRLPRPRQIPQRAHLPEEGREIAHRRKLLQNSYGRFLLWGFVI